MPCQHCAAPLPPGRKRRFCGPRCSYFHRAGRPLVPYVARKRKRTPATLDVSNRYERELAAFGVVLSAGELRRYRAVASRLEREGEIDEQ